MSDRPICPDVDSRPRAQTTSADQNRRAARVRAPPRDLARGIGLPNTGFRFTLLDGASAEDCIASVKALSHPPVVH
jgi:hypothetical protein